MCADGWDHSEDAVGECPECGEGVDKDGDAVQGCNYSPYTCKTCGARPCDQSC
jgi:hypothetical protein